MKQYIGAGNPMRPQFDARAAYQAQHGGDVCDIHNVLIGVECRPFTRTELEAKEQAEALQRWNDRVAGAEARRRVAQQMDDLLHYGQ